jgi:hypothetical protein
MITFSKLGRYGRFANQLYQIAGVIGIAVKSGQTFAFPDWQNHDHKERFAYDGDIALSRHFVNPLPTIPHGLNFMGRFVHWGYHDVYLPSGNWDIEGHLQSPQYFEHCMDTVRFYMKMKDEYRKIQAIAIHYRAGDYIADPNAYHPRMQREYYEAALKHMPADLPINIFTDDIADAKQLFEPIVQGREVFPWSGDYVHDFKLMKAHTHFIIANSSYSAFAATIADGVERVVSPRRWFGPVAGITGDDIHVKNWLQI